MKCTINKTNHWQNALINAVNDPIVLIKLLELDENLIEPAKKAAELFPLKVPHSFIARMKKGDPNDPLLRQVLPLQEEFHTDAAYLKDPLQEKAANPISGLLHKYESRVLLTLTGACGINCRYCFRRHFDYKKNTPGSNGWDEALNYIQEDKKITEVILSGGDPLVSSDKTLQTLTEKLANISHVKILRVHSRMPIVLPERITSDLIAAITHPRLKTVFVTHCNHPQEINQDVKDGMLRLMNANIVLLNQAVLLRGVNDDADILVALSEALFSAGILPYYMHLLDKVEGVAHFDLAREEALLLKAEMTKRLPGYLVPKFVYEEAGARAKTILI